MQITADINATIEDKATVTKQLKNSIQIAGFNIVDQDVERPWGAFFVIDSKQTSKFANLYFSSLSDITKKQIDQELPLTPKILLVAPDQQLSWQYHHRRGEIWHVVAGPVALAQSKTDELPDNLEEKQVGNSISLAAGQRHRLVGLSNWGIIAEIWLHTDSEKPSDENDIVRVSDDYGR